MSDLTESTLAKLSRLDRRWLFLALWIIILLPYFVNFALPMNVTQRSQDFYNYLNNMPQGSVVLWGWDVSFAGWSEMEAQGVAVTKLLFKLMAEKGFRIVIMGYREECGNLPEMVMRQLGMHPTQNQNYGKNYAHIGWLPGGSVGMASFAKNMRATLPKDWWGTPLDNLQVMKDINTIQDVDLVIYIESGGCELAITQYVVPYNTNLGVCAIAQNVPGNMPRLDAGLIKIMLAGIRGGAELEMLTGQLGVGTKNITGISTTHLVIMGFMLVANISYFLRRSRGEI